MGVCRPAPAVPAAGNLTVPLPAGTVAAAAAFKPKRALELTQDLWGIARRMDSRAIAAAAEFVAEELQEAGIETAQVETFPANGVSAAGGWLLPVSWGVSTAVLETAGRDRAGECLANYAENAQSLAMYSPGTPHGGWVGGPVVTAPSVSAAGRRLRGAFLYMPGPPPSPDVNAEAAAAGALGVIACVPNAAADAARYLNYAVPLDAQRPCVPCFSLTPARGGRLEALLRDDPRLRLRARVQAKRGPGTIPVVTATLGRGEPSIYLCAHLDEIGAQDNASGVGVAVEALRVLAGLTGRPGFLPPQRALRVLFSVEVRGLQAWLNQRKRPPRLLAGLNLDMVGREPQGEAERFLLGRGFRGQSHFASRLLGAAAGLANAQAGHMDTRNRHCLVSDAFVGLGPEPGHVSIEQAAGTVYHTSADTPAPLSLRALQWSGTAAVAFLYAATRFGAREALLLARRVVVDARREAARRPAAADAIAVAMRAEVDSLRQAFPTPEFFGSWRQAEDCYRLGVSRRTGLWPAVADRQRFEALAAALPVAAPRATAVAADPRAVRARRAAAAMAPAVTFRGFLAFEDHVTAAQRQALADALGMVPGWGSEPWAWGLAARLTGKATLADVVDQMDALGLKVDMSKAVALVNYLVRIGKARLRPILQPVDLRRALRAVGVRRGSILCLHASLSQFGYIPGGAATLVDAVREVLGPRGTLCMPAHSLSVLGNTPYEPRRSPSLVGTVSDHLLQRSGALRSDHPTHSVVAIGPAARALTALPRPDLAPLGREGFWGKLYDAAGDVLLLCPVTSATIFHAGENWTGVPQPPLVVHARTGNGRRRVFTIPQAPWHTDHFERTMAAPLLRSGAMRTARLGEGTIYLASARAMADVSVAVNRANPLVSLGQNGGCRCFYCRALRRGMEMRS